MFRLVIITEWGLFIIISVKSSKANWGRPYHYLADDKASSKVELGKAYHLLLYMVIWRLISTVFPKFNPFSKTCT